MTREGPEVQSLEYSTGMPFDLLHVVEIQKGR